MSHDHHNHHHHSHDHHHDHHGHPHHHRHNEPPHAHDHSHREQDDSTRSLSRFTNWARSYGWTSFVVVIALYVASGLFYVSADQQAVRIRFGRLLSQRIQPGLHYSWPYPVDRVVRLRVNQAQRLSIGTNDLSRALGLNQSAPADYLLTGDQNLVRIQATIQYYIQDPARYLFRAESLPKSLETLFFRCVSRSVALRQVDDVLTTGRAALQSEVQRGLQREADELGLGIAISTVALEQVSPPEEVRDAFLDVANSREDRNRIVQEANGYANELLPRARGQAKEMLQKAEIYRTELVNRASGESERFVSLWQEYRDHRDVTSARLFLEAMEEILPRMRKIVLDDSAGGQGVDLDIFEVQKK